MEYTFTTTLKLYKTGLPRPHPKTTREPREGARGTRLPRVGVLVFTSMPIRGIVYVRPFW